MADAGNRRIRQVSLAGFVTTIAGSGDDGAKDGLALEASFRTPVGVTVASDGTIFVIDATAYEIRAITPDRSTVYTVAGVDFGACNPTPLKDQPAPSPPAGLKCAEPYTQLLRNGDARDALFDQPSSAVVLPDGSLLVADSGNHCIRRIADGLVSTFAGRCQAGSADGAADEAAFTAPVESGARRVWKSLGDGRLRADSQDGADGIVTTVAGSETEGDTDGSLIEARFHGPAGIASDGDRGFIVADGQRVRRITNAGVTTVAGAGPQGMAVGTGPTAQFSALTGVAVGPGGVVFVSDWNLGRIFRLTRE